MLIARVLYPVEVLGPGKRLGIWVCGCNHKCFGCSNPELWEFDSMKSISIVSLLFIINEIYSQNEIDGITITGGEPFEQVDDLLQLVKGLSKISKDILIYSGYTLEELEQKDDANIDCILQNISVLIDSKYVENCNTGVALRGSDNQRIIIFNEDYKAIYGKYTENLNKIQNFYSPTGIISVGIHKPDFNEDLNKRMTQYGILKEE